MPSFFSRIFILLFLLGSTLISVGQNKFLNLGFGHNGICIGNSLIYNGLRLNAWDHNLKKVNGINLVGVRTDYYLDQPSVCSVNGMSIGVVSADATKLNGIAIGGLLAVSEKVNGVLIGGIIAASDTVNGFIFGGWCFQGNGRTSSSLISLINGVAVALGNKVKCMKGLQIGIVNEAEELHGVQIGLLNYATNNNGQTRVTPIINFNFRSKRKQ